MLAKIINVGPVRTRYFQVGNPDGQNLVLIHEGGYGGDAPNTWGRLVSYLESEFNILMPEMLGFGGTDKAVFFGENPYQPRLRHLICLFDLLGIENAHLIGNSFGGGVSLRLAMDPHSSWRFKSVTSISGTGGPFRTPEGLAGAFEYTPSLEEAKRLDTWVLGDEIEDVEHSQQRFESSMLPGQWESMVAPKLKNPSLEDSGIVQWDLPEGLKAITMPTMFLAGTEDKMLISGWENKMAEHVQNVTTKTMKAGHSPNISHPEETAILLRKFFKAVEENKHS